MEPSSGNEMLTVTLLVKCRGALRDFLGSELFLVSRDKPNMAKRICQRARAVTVELVLHGSHRLRTRMDGPCK